MVDLLFVDNASALVHRTVDVALTIRFHVLDELRNAKEVVHLFERETLGFWDEEPYKDEHGEAERSVKKETTRVLLAHRSPTGTGERRHTRNHPCPW